MSHPRQFPILIALMLAVLTPHDTRAQTATGDDGSPVPTMALLGMGAGFVGLLGSIGLAEVTGSVAAQIGGSRARGTGEWIGIVAVQPLATAWGVHVGNDRRGSIGKTVLASYAATAATGLVATAIASSRGESLDKYTSDNIGFFLAGIATQTVAAIIAERATTPSTRASSGVAVSYNPVSRVVAIRRSF